MFDRVTKEQSNPLVILFALSSLLGFSTSGAVEKETDVVYTSPSGAFRVEVSPPEVSATAEEVTGDLWVVSTKDPAQRAKLPKEAADSPLDDEFHCSPDEEWIFGLRHVGSGLRYGNVYHRVNPTHVEVLARGFNDLVWKNGLKLGALKQDYSAPGVYAMTSFVCWSLDSSRLLVQLSGGEEKRAMHSALIYYNIRTKQFEMTDYLRKLNKAKSDALACAEPVDSLPSEGELKKRLDTLDEQLNRKYAEVVSQTEKNRISLLRESQRNWIKHRDEGATFYVSFFPAAEKERRRLQFLGDVTATRIEVPSEEWEL